MLKQKYFLVDIFILSAEKQPIKLSWRKIVCLLNEFYGTDGIHGYGYGQDEDQGQLGAWYVISSLGLFDVKGLTDPQPSFGLGVPLFDKITIKLNEEYYPGKEFVITVSDNTGSDTYVRKLPKLAY